MAAEIGRDEDYFCVNSKQIECIIFSNTPLGTHSEASEKHMRIAEKTLRIIDLQYANYSTAICEGIICDSHAFLEF